MVPLVLELFTSEGCSSCPPADLLLGELLKKQADSGPDLIGLAYHVDYWNRLGWPDRFSDEKYTRLQRQYGRWLKDPQIYTPELVVQGVAGVVGSNRKAVASAMQQEPAAAPHYQLQLQVTQVAGAAQIEYSITPPPGDPSTAIVRTMLVQSQASTRVERGENGGRTLRHVNIVRGMEIGPAAATGTASLSIPEKESGTFSVVCILQNANTGHIQAALQQEIP